ncbi:hypothetical protein GS531_00380 [Rhodococcus hoagii]|nr:hypothetical protein [Prescottella equi]
MTYRLPASLTPAPSDAYTVTGIKSLDTSDGYAYTGTLRAGKRIIGNVENSGTGGPTTVYLKDPAKDRAPWLEWAAKWPEARGPQDDEWRPRNSPKRPAGQVPPQRESTRNPRPTRRGPLVADPWIQHRDRIPQRHPWTPGVAARGRTVERLLGRDRVGSDAVVEE